MSSKTESPYKGPYIVKEILKDHNAVIVENEFKESLESLHNIKRLS